MDNFKLCKINYFFFILTDLGLYSHKTAREQTISVRRNPRSTVSLVKNPVLESIIMQFKQPLFRYDKQVLMYAHS